MSDTPCCTHMQAPPATVFKTRPSSPAASVTPADETKLVALTFDDGPATTSTDRVLALMESFGIKTTFFVVGQMVENNGSRTKAALDAGHLIANHSFTHPEFSKLSADGMASEIDRTTAAMVAVGIPVPSYFRPPYGDRDGAALAAILDQRGMTPVYWTIDSRDWEMPDVETIHQNVLADLRVQWDRSNFTNIVLFHDIQTHTPDVIEALVPDLIAAGCRFVRIDEIV